MLVVEVRMIRPAFRPHKPSPLRGSLYHTGYTRTYIYTSDLSSMAWYNYHYGGNWWQRPYMQSIAPLPADVRQRLPRVALTGSESLWTLSDTTDEPNQWFLE